MANIIFIHGLESSGKGFKGQLFKQKLPGILTPDFRGTLEKRMTKLKSILDEKVNWIIIGSSFGGLMGALYTCENPHKIKKLILLAPYIVPEAIKIRKIENIPVDVPVVAFHGKHDNVVFLEKAQFCARKLFSNLSYNIVDDDHMLRKTVIGLNWNDLIKIE